MARKTPSTTSCFCLSALPLCFPVSGKNQKPSRIRGSKGQSWFLSELIKEYFSLECHHASQRQCSHGNIFSTSLHPLARKGLDGLQGQHPRASTPPGPLRLMLATVPHLFQ